MSLIIVPSADSTNALLREACHDHPHGYAVMAREQTAGRGQRGNSWEAQPGMNVSLSILLRPLSFKASRQFALSCAVALAVRAILLDEGLQDVTVKWPNDIYCGDRKICGLLLENTLRGAQLEACIAGVGLNVNQTRFLSDAPNPVSMAMLTGRNYDVESIGRALASRIADATRSLLPEGDATLLAAYRQALWRRSGLHRWHDALRDEDITAAVDTVAPDGRLTLVTTAGERRSYLFKEVASLL